MTDQENSRAEEELRDRMHYLVSELKRHNYLYHTLDAPEITDDEYDRLFRELQALEDQHPALKLPDSPTLKIGSSVLPGLEKKPHAKRMYGLDNVFSTEEWLAFIERMKRAWDDVNALKLEFWCDPKLDGLAIELTYENGLLAQALTRGDGEQGEVVTAQARSIRNLPLSFSGTAPFPASIQIRGEVVIFRKDFVRLNDEQARRGLKIFANPRNAAAGAIRQLDLSITRSRPLKFLAYGIGAVEWGKFQPILGQSSLVDQFSQWGFQLPPDGKLCSNMEDVVSYVENARIHRQDYPMEIDGVVAKLENLAAQDRLGYTSRAPKFAIAFKFPAMTAQTRLLNIEIQVGRTGALTPVAILEPVSIGGVVVSRATLHNEDEIRLLDLRIGDIVNVRRAGDVIPEVTGPVPEKRPAHTESFKFPHKCPACGEPVYREPDEAVWRCNNMACPAINYRSILHFASKQGLNIQGFGEKLIGQLIQSGSVKSIADLLYLTEDKLMKFERMGPVLASKLIASIQQAKATATLPRLIAALGIRLIGEQTAKNLGAHFADLDFISSASTEELLGVPDIGPEAAASIRAFFDNPANQIILRRLKDAGLWPRYISKQSSPHQELVGKSFLFTGTLSKPRDYFQALVEDAGGTIKNSVSKNLDYLIAGEKPGSKLQKAEALGINIINEAQFLKMLGLS